MIYVHGMFDLRGIFKNITLSIIDISLPSLHFLLPFCSEDGGYVHTCPVQTCYVLTDRRVGGEVTEKTCQRDKLLYQSFQRSENN